SSSPPRTSYLPHEHPARYISPSAPSLEGASVGKQSVAFELGGRQLSKNSGSAASARHVAASVPGSTTPHCKSSTSLSIERPQGRASQPRASLTSRVARTVSRAERDGSSTTLRTPRSDDACRGD